VTLSSHFKYSVGNLCAVRPTSGEASLGYPDAPRFTGFEVEADLVDRAPMGEIGWLGLIGAAR
jgi:hypothetical protein